MIVPLSPTEFDELRATLELDVVDVRSPTEYASGHVPRARNVPLEAFLADPIAVYRGMPLVLVCARGTRSHRAAEAAVIALERSVYDLIGGTVAWVAAALPIERGPSGDGTRLRETDDRDVSGEGESTRRIEAELEATIAANVRAHRAKLGLSLDHLSRASGVARSLLGQIELGRARPTIGTIWRIARALEQPFSALLATDAPPMEAVQRRASARRMTSADGRFSSRALIPPGQGRQAEFYELHLAPHAREDAEPHRHGTTETLVVTSGRLELTVDGLPRTLEAGDATTFRADVRHAYANLSGIDCWIYLVMTYAGD